MKRAQHGLWLLHQLRWTDQWVFEKQSSDGSYPIHFVLSHKCTVDPSGLVAARELVKSCWKPIHSPPSIRSTVDWLFTWQLKMVGHAMICFCRSFRKHVTSPTQRRSSFHFRRLRRKTCQQHRWMSPLSFYERTQRMPGAWGTTLLGLELKPR